jgi:thiol:disulfide interchange protein
MKNPTIILLLVATLIMSFRFFNDSPNNSDEGIVFHEGQWQEALEKAKAENKLIFLDIYATWCGPCKMLKNNTFSNKEVGSVYNEKFINVALDGEKGEGAELAKKYNVRGYPTLLFVNHKGEIVVRTSGYHPPKEFLTLAEEVLKISKP